MDNPYRVELEKRLEYASKRHAAMVMANAIIQSTYPESELARDFPGMVSEYKVEYLKAAKRLEEYVADYCS